MSILFPSYSMGLFSLIVMILSLPILSLIIRRLHDSERKGSWILLIVAPLLIAMATWTYSTFFFSKGDRTVKEVSKMIQYDKTENLDIYVTGSNSQGLSSDIATEFRGRATQIHVYPLSFAEFYSSCLGNESEALNNFMIYGGMPRITSYKTDEDKKNYLANLYKELYIKDIKERNKIEREDILNEILDYLASQIGSLTNPYNISNSLSTLNKEKISQNLVSSYLEHARDAFLIYIVKRYDIKGKSYFNYPNKYYYSDCGLRNARLNFRQFDPGHIMENILYNDLIRRGYSVDVGVVYDRKSGSNGQKEIDFVINNGDKRVYIQSALRIDTDKKEEAEISSLKLTNDFFKKIVIRMDLPHSFYDEAGVFHCGIVDFLLERVSIF